MPVRIADAIPDAWRPKLAALSERLRQLLPLPRNVARRPARQDRVDLGPRVLVAGLFCSRTGLGRGAELVALSLEAEGREVVRVDLAEPLQLGFARDIVGRTVPIGTAWDWQPTGIVIHVNPPHSLRAIKLMPCERLRSLPVVGFWLWELESVPASWVREALALDEIWAPSPLIVQALMEALVGDEKKVHLVPYRCDLDRWPRPTETERATARAALGLPDCAFVAGYSFAMNSNYERKNPMAAIASFQRAFPQPDDGARLLLRCHDCAGYGNGCRALSAAAMADKRIMLLDGVRNAIGMRDFYAAIDVYVAPFRSEGFGLNLVEASDAGLPVIATGWCLAPEIASLPSFSSAKFTLVPVREEQGHYIALGRGARWAEPSLTDLARLLRLARTSIRRYAARGGGWKS